MLIENADALRCWLTSYLEPLCDADPAALAKYVMALIKKDKPEKDLKTVCLDQLEVFLQKETITFVDTLFETISTKSYLKSSTITSTTKPSQSTSLVTNIVSNVNVTQMLDTSHDSKVSTNVAEQAFNSSPNSVQQSVNKPEANVSSNHDSYAPINKARDNTANKRNRSRSRSRSPFRSNRNRDFDYRSRGAIAGKNVNTYFADDRRNRRGNNAKNSNNNANRNRFGGYSRDARDYRRQRDLKRGRSRSRSRSWSSGSQSRSRSRSRSRSWSKERESPLNKRSRPSSQSPSSTTKDRKDGEKSKRCRDYDEKGFCMKGDLCPYDHGSDPVVLDGTLGVSAALGLTSSNQNSGPLLPLPNQPMSANAPNFNLAEPYNPEAPGMDVHVAAGTAQRPQPPPQLGPPRLPPPHYWGPMPPIRGPLPPGRPMPPPPQFMAPMGRPRELIGVPTIDNGFVHNQPLSNRTVIEPNITSSGTGMRGGMRGGIGKGIGRGGYRNVRRINNESSDRTCLEVRKIPTNLNTISHLNQHFSKFGTIVNLQVCHEGDPEAALVQFATHQEAIQAIRNTEAVLNNRFIKVFWHSKDQQQAHEQNQVVTKTEQTDNSANVSPNKLSIKDRLGPKVTESTESVLTAVNSSGTISRTVFDPSKLKKTNSNNNNNNSGNNNLIIPEENITSQNANNAIKTQKIEKLQNQKKQIEVYSKQQELLLNYLEKQKQLMVIYKNTSNDKEKKKIKDTIDDVMTKIQNLQESIQKAQTDMLAKKSLEKPQTKDELMEELLNTDLEMHIKIQNNDTSYLDLAKKFAKLKKKAKLLGIAPYNSPFMRGSKSSSFSRRGRSSRRGSFYARGSNSLLKVDRRTRKILIADINADDISDLLEHLAQFSDVEVIEPSNAGAIVTFKTRHDAEQATQHMATIKFKEHFQLNYSWFDEKKLMLSKNKNEAKISNESEADSEALLPDSLLDELEDEDETEDESEARNWKG